MEERLESPYFNNLLQFVAQEERYNRELRDAKEEFEAFAGPIYESDRTYDARINSFHNWYILDRPLKATGVTPLQYFLDYNANSLPRQEWYHYKELEANLHSLFDLVKLTRNATRVRDLLSGRKCDILGNDATHHLDPGVLFNSRLFCHGNAWYFTNYFLLHPAVVGKQIRAEARKARKAREDPKPFLFRLLLYQSRFDQYKQMEPAKIYRFTE
jgi:hypothetical protein